MHTHTYTYTARHTQILIYTHTDNTKQCNRLLFPLPPPSQLILNHFSLLTPLYRPSIQIISSAYHYHLYSLATTFTHHSHSLSHKSFLWSSTSNRHGDFFKLLLLEIASFILRPALSLSPPLSSFTLSLSPAFFTFTYYINLYVFLFCLSSPLLFRLLTLLTTLSPALFLCIFLLPSLYLLCLLFSHCAYYPSLPSCSTFFLLSLSLSYLIFVFSLSFILLLCPPPLLLFLYSLTLSLLQCHSSFSRISYYL